MALVELASINSLLACPRCRCAVVPDNGAFRCSSGTCVFGVPEAFPVIGRWPALVDFERSILSLDELHRSPGSPRSGSERWSIDRLPAWARRQWKPVNRVAAANVAQLSSLLSGSLPLVLVVGGGTIGNGVEALYADRRIGVIGFDIYGSRLTQLIADAHQIPLASQSADAVVIQAVLEHVLNPGQVVSEIHRVLKPRGVVYAETPFLQQVHAGPYDFARYTGSGHRYLFRAFEEIAAGPVAGPGTELLWSLDHLVRGLLRSEVAGKIARGLLFWLRYLDRMVPPDFTTDSASAFYFLGRSAERELSSHEIVSYYRGAQRTR